MSWDERDGLALDRADRDRSRGRAPGGVQLDLVDVVEERIEPRAAEDADTDGLAVLFPAQADFSFELPEPESAPLLPLPAPLSVFFVPWDPELPRESDLLSDFEPVPSPSPPDLLEAPALESVT